MDLIYVDGCGEVENENVKNCILISNIYIYIFFFFFFFFFFGGGGGGGGTASCATNVKTILFSVYHILRDEFLSESFRNFYRK